MSKQYAWIGCVILALTVAITWYIRRDGSGPIENELRVQFAAEIPAYLHLMSFEVQASAPIGDKVEPAFKARFHASVRLESDTFNEIHREDGVVYVRSSQLEVGHTKELYGIALSTLNADSWNTAFTLEGDPLGAIGKPIVVLEEGRVRVHDCGRFPPIVIEPTHDQKICLAFAYGGSL
jgi:hypothetical protein